MRNLIMVLILCLSSLMAKSQNRYSQHIEISKDSLIKNYSDYFSKEEDITIKGFIVSAYVKDNLVKEVSSVSGELNEGQKALIREVSKGGKVYFDKIEYVNSKGEKEIHKTLVFELRE